MIESPPTTLPSELGFRSGARGTHTSRTMMLSELASVLEATPNRASLADYQAAFARERNESIIPAGSLKTARPVGVRPPWHEQEAVEREPDAREKARETADLLWKLNKYAFIACACGARLKVPPGFKSAQVRCPRCERVHDVPQAG